MKKDAVFSESRTYRYMLSRIWDESKNKVCFIGLNPSTADESKDDPTIRRCVNFADSWGYGGIYMLNLFAYRATDPKIMKAYSDPVGVLNDLYIENYVYQSDVTIAAWGNHGKFKKRDLVVVELLNGNLSCIAKSKDGNPKHPLYLKKDLKPILY